MADALTDRQRQVLELFVVAVRDGTPWPTYHGICEELGFASTHAAWCHGRALVKKGWLERDGRGHMLLTAHARRHYGLPVRRAA